jgi:nucleoside-diphosphate-sugar epimerase
VAGRRRTGVIGERDLDTSYGFENPYEESKSDGERAVHEWSRRHGRSAMIFRPSVLITDRRAPPGGASHPLRVASTLFDFHADALLERLAAGGRLRVRIEADGGAHLNLIPVELAAKLMVGLAARIRPRGVHTAHITHPQEVAVSTLLSMFEHRYPIRLEPGSDLPPPRERTLLESLVAAKMRGFTPYWFHRRHYDRGELRTACLDPSDAPPLDLNYLLASIGNGNQTSGPVAAAF